MPFTSKAQAAFMHSEHPDIAARWDKITDFSKLPERLHPKKSTSVLARVKEKLAKKRN